MSARDKRIFDKLFLVAIATPPVARCRVAAALVIRNNVLALGVNSYSSSKLARQFAKSSLCLSEHAEIAAIRNYVSLYGLKNLSKCTMYVCRAKRKGEAWTTGIAKPCKGCLQAINAFGVKNVKWT